ncbi:MAG: uridine kinase [Candidatus Rokuibacteriota bacterium]
MSTGPRDEPLTDLFVEEGTRRVHLKNPLMMESLLDKALIQQTYIPREVPILPDANLVHLGGLSIIDRGRAALSPLVEELAAVRPRHKIILGVGGGIRERHTYAIAIDLGLPTGALAQLAGATCEQNAIMVYNLLARHTGIRLSRENFHKLPFYLEAGAIPVIVDMPPYHFWEHVTKRGRIPMHRPDSGSYLVAEVYSCRSCIFLKDVDGLYTADPRKDRGARLIPKISTSELFALDLPDLPIERSVLEVLHLARNRREIRLINGLVPGTLTRALDGEEVGTLIYQG